MTPCEDEKYSFEEPNMAMVVTEPCFGCKYTDCVVVCPVDCFYEGESMLFIHPDECIDCGLASRSARRRRSFMKMMCPNHGGITRAQSRNGTAMPEDHGTEDAVGGRLPNENRPWTETATQPQCLGWADGTMKGVTEAAEMNFSNGRS